MAERRWCEKKSDEWVSRRGGASPATTTRDNQYTTPVRQATSRPGSVQAGHRQAEEGRVSPTADGRKRGAPSTASRYLLRSTQACACRRETQAWPGVRLATSPAKAKAHNTRSRDDASHRGRSGNGHRRATDARKSARDQQTEQRQPRTSHRPRRKSVAQRLLKARKTDRFGTWNVRTLRGIGKMEQLAMEMERYRLSMLAVTETHLAGEGEMVLDECRGYKMLFAGRKDGRAAEGVGLALTPHAWAALRHYQPVSP